MTKGQAIGAAILVDCSVLIMDYLAVTSAGSEPIGKWIRFHLYRSARVAPSLQFETGSCYHLIWKTTQRSNTTNDGTLKIVTFDPAPSQPVYDTDYPSNRRYLAFKLVERQFLFTYICKIEKPDLSSMIL